MVNPRMPGTSTFNTHKSRNIGTNLKNKFVPRPGEKCEKRITTLLGNKKRTSHLVGNWNWNWKLEPLRFSLIVYIFLPCEQNLPIKEESTAFQPTLELSSIFSMVGFPLVQRPGVSKRSLI
jgi:hypothetical protein